MYNPDVPEIPAWTLLNEWAGLQFLNQITGGASFSPRFYAGDRTTGNDSYAAENALVEFAAAHGRLHALTAGKQTDFEEIRKVLGPSELGSGYYNYHWLAPTLYETASVLSITPNRGVDDELARLTASLQNPGHFLVIIA